MSFPLSDVIERYRGVQNVWFNGCYEGYQDLLSKTRYIIRVDPSPMSIALNEIWNMYSLETIWMGITVANNDGTVRVWAEDVTGDLNGNYFRINSIELVLDDTNQYSSIVDIKMEGLFPLTLLS